MKFFLSQIIICFLLGTRALWGQSITVNIAQADRGTELQVSITGSDFKFIQGSSTANMCPDIPVFSTSVIFKKGEELINTTGTQFTSEHQIAVSLTVPPG